MLSGFRSFIYSGPILTTNNKYEATMSNTGKGLSIRNHLSTSLPETEGEKNRLVLFLLASKIGYE